MSEGHSHTDAVSAAGRHRRPLVIALVITAVYMVVEALTGILTGSLALLSDAGHMLTDVVGLGMALAAIQFASRSRERSNTFGLYRLEVLAGLANAVLLFGVAIYVLYEAVQRFSDPPDIAGAPMLIVAAVGLGVNLVSFRLLRAGAAESLNVKGAFLEVMADALGSAGVLLAGAIVLITGWPYADPIIGAGIGLFILPRTWRLGRAAIRILLESAPPDVDVEEVESRLSGLAGVLAVHDLHIWTVTSGVDAASAHLELAPGAALGDVLGRATRLLEVDFGIDHVTLQCEPEGHEEEPARI